jgi:hypothetical protein
MVLRPFDHPEVYKDERIVPLYRCANRCFSDFDPFETCPKCGHDVYPTPAMSLGGTIFYRKGRDLVILDRQQQKDVVVEWADTEDLRDFLEKAIIPFG